MAMVSFTSDWLPEDGASFINQSQSVVKQTRIGHFRVAFCHCSKARSSANLSV